MTKQARLKCLFILLPFVAASVGVGVTYAAFASTDKADQFVSVKGGERKKLIYLDCEARWNLGFNELFYAYVWKGGTGTYLRPTRAVTANISGVGNVTLRVYEYDTNAYDHFRFARINPDGLTASSDDSAIDAKVWNKSYEIEDDGDYNYFQMVNWVSETSYTTHKKANLTKSGSTISRTPLSNEISADD